MVFYLKTFTDSICRFYVWLPVWLDLLHADCCDFCQKRTRCTFSVRLNREFCADRGTNMPGEFHISRARPTVGHCHCPPPVLQCTWHQCFSLQAMKSLCGDSMSFLPALPGWVNGSDFRRGPPVPRHEGTRNRAAGSLCQGKSAKVVLASDHNAP